MKHPVMIAITRIIVQTTEVQVDLEGTTEEEINAALDTHFSREGSEYLDIEDKNWDLESAEIENYEVTEYPEFTPTDEEE